MSNPESQARQDHQNSPQTQMKTAQDARNYDEQIRYNNELQRQRDEAERQRQG